MSEFLKEVTLIFFCKLIFKGVSYFESASRRSHVVPIFSKDPFDGKGGEGKLIPCKLKKKNYQNHKNSISMDLVKSIL